MQTRMTLWIASALSLFGVVMFLGTGATSPTALIPSLVGVLLLVAERYSRQERLYNSATYGATLVALLGLLSASVSLVTYIDIVGPVASVSKLIMAALCGVALVLYIQAHSHRRQPPMQHA